MKFFFLGRVVAVAVEEDCVINHSVSSRTSKTPPTLTRHRRLPPRSAVSFPSPLRRTRDQSHLASLSHVEDTVDFDQASAAIGDLQRFSGRRSQLTEVSITLTVSNWSSTRRRAIVSSFSSEAPDVVDERVAAKYATSVPSV
jgi:hypothetical protein